MSVVTLDGNAFPSVLNVRVGGRLRRYVPERTCHMVFDDKWFGYGCDKCGSVSQTYHHPNGDWYVPEYCPNCGSKVMPHDRP